MHLAIGDGGSSGRASWPHSSSAEASPSPASIPRAVIRQYKLDSSNILLVYVFQKNLLQAMLAVEQIYENLGRQASEAGHNCILLCDRGAMDISAYMSPSH